VAIWQKLSLEDQLSNSLVVLASIYRETGRQKQAEAAYQRALAINEKLHGAESENVAITLENLAALYAEAGRYSDAEQTYRRAITVFEKAVGPDAPYVAISLNGLGGVLSKERHDRDAEAALHRALVILEKAFGPNSTAVAGVLGDLASVLSRGGRPAEAEPLLRKSLANYEKTYGSDHPFVATVLNNLAGTIADQGRPAEAEALYRRSLVIDEKAKGNNDASDVGVIANLANVAWAQGHLDDAEAFFKRDVAIADGPQKPVPEHLDNLFFRYALFLRETGKLPQAEAMATRALTEAKASFGANHLRVSNDLGTLASIEDDQNRSSDALPLWRQASEIALKAKRVEGAGPGGNDAARAVSYASVGLVHAAWRVAASDPSQAPALAEEAFVAAQRSQSSVAGTALAQMAVRFAAGDSAISAVVRRQQDLSAEAKALGDRLTAALGATSAKVDETQLTALRAQIADANASLDKVSHEISTDYPKYAELSAPEPPDLAATRALLGPDEALISWLILDKEIYAFALTREGDAWRKLDISNLKEAVSKLRKGIDMDAVTTAWSKKEFAPNVLFDLGAANALYEKLVAPVVGLIAGKHSWIVVPSGALTSLPLSLLVTKAPDHPATAPDDPAYRDAAWLARDHAISVLPSVSALRSLRVYAKPSQATKPLVGFADPVFSPAPLVASNDPAPASRSLAVKSYRSYFRGGAVDLDALRAGLPPLPETATELHEVAQALKAPDDDLRIGAAATVTAVKAMPLAQFHVIYFATHGLVSGDVDGLNEPALALSIPAAPTPTDDGLLKASDVTQLTLDADWVVLSACNTAVGDTPGAEGLSGLARAFFYAGARALLVSHWPVESNAAVALTTQSFRAMADDPKLGRAEALRRSMIALIEKGGENAYPGVWAPFSVVGEGGLR
jgi:CHAT domain-containing protein/Tfp pilus assembly protein PilF